jgi:hypothetical protein
MCVCVDFVGAKVSAPAGIADDYIGFSSSWRMQVAVNVLMRNLLKIPEDFKAIVKTDYLAFREFLAAKATLRCAE